LSSQYPKIAAWRGKVFGDHPALKEVCQGLYDFVSKMAGAAAASAGASSGGKPVLQYFDAFGRAEPIRMACAMGRLDYEDKRLSQEEFGKMKMAGEFPMGSVPVWIEDGVKYCQSNTILRMVGQRTGQYPTDVHQAWKVDSACEAVEDNSKGFNGYVGK